MASSSEPKILAFKAAAAIAKGKAVKAGADIDHVAVCSAGTDNAIGIVQNIGLAAEDVLEVAVSGGGAKALLGGTVAVGDALTADSNGALVATTSNADNIIAVAMQSGVAADIIGVEVVFGIV